MKNIFKVFCLIALILTSLSNRVEAIEMNNTKNVKLYEVKDKEEVLVENNEVLKFFETNLEVLNELLEEKAEEERIILEQEQERIRQERIRQEQERIRQEQQRIRMMEQQQAYESSVVHDDTLGSAIAEFASQFVGNPYVYGGTSLTNGADCSGFVMSVYANFGISLPRTAPAQSYSGYAVSIENIQPGDIVSYGYNGSVTHSALYVGNGTIVHASTPANGIMFSSLYIMPIMTIRRVV